MKIADRSTPEAWTYLFAVSKFSCSKVTAKSAIFSSHKHFAFTVCQTYRKTATQSAILGFDLINIYHVIGF